MKIFFRSLLGAVLIFNFFNAFASGIVPKFSEKTWGAFTAGPFLTVLGAWAVIEILNLYSPSKSLPAYFWALAGTGTLIDSTSDYAGLFDRFSDLDKVLHFLIGGVLAGFLAIKLVEHYSRRHKISRFIRFGIALMLVNLVGFIYEFFELIAQKYFGAKNITSLFDTTEDLTFNILGALAVIGFYILFGKKRDNKTD